MARIEHAGKEFEIRLNYEELRDFEAFSEEFPFAISLAMNLTAKNDAVPYMREGLSVARPKGAGFTVRTPYTEGGIKFYRSSRKNDLVVKVGAVSEYLLAQTEGTADNTRPESSNVGAIPLGPTRDPKTKKTQRRNEWPMMLIRRGLAFRPGVDHRRKTTSVQVKTKSGKIGKRKIKDKPDPLEPGQVLYGTKKSPFPGLKLWLVEDNQNIELQPVYPALPLVAEAFNGNFSDNLATAIRKAVKMTNKLRRARALR